AAGGGRDLGGVGAPVAGCEDDDVAVAAVEDDRLHDLSEVAARRAGGVTGGWRPDGELFQPRFRARLAEERRDALDGLRPVRHARRVGETPRAARAFPPWQAQRRRETRWRTRRSESRRRSRSSATSTSGSRRALS